MRKLIVLRPEPGASETVERATALGLEARAMPLFKVGPVDWSVPDAGSFDAILLTSANAVRHAGPQLKGLRGLPVHAVGEATAAAAREAGFDIRSAGNDGVERLLGSVEQGVKLLHLCGAHRKDVGARQAIVAIPVYVSEALPAPEAFADVQGATVALHSPRAAIRFAELARTAEFDRGSVRIAAISAAALAAAGDGWDRSEAARTPSDDALLAAAARLCDKVGHQ